MSVKESKSGTGKDNSALEGIKVRGHLDIENEKLKMSGTFSFLVAKNVNEHCVHSKTRVQWHATEPSPVSESVC